MPAEQQSNAFPQRQRLRLLAAHLASAGGAPAAVAAVPTMASTAVDKGKFHSGFELAQIARLGPMF
jgi:hypothetical protein